MSYDVEPRTVVKAVEDGRAGRQDWRRAAAATSKRGAEAYLVGQCVKCHRFGNEGGAVGPDLTAISSRFSRKDVLESIVEPSKVVSDQYQNERFVTATGKTVVGRVVDDTPDALVVQPDPLLPERVTIKKADLESRSPSKVSPMPANLVDVLTEDEILDLLAFLETSGKGFKGFRK